ncbi:hypothetical protein EVAR_103854_1 [Eumeta japonica]|uniref:Uncharacterized protein n=1 Tax=Eumeta variegata TaxID=151549 RepID=A0A4C2A903_EUMVA|nr:hypothetical protein EVAR_103854_1 [Eumeta japonica]
MADREESAIFTPRQSLCRTPPSGITILEDLPTGSAAGKRPRESPGEENPAAKPRLETEAMASDSCGARYGEKEELMHRCMTREGDLGTGGRPGSKLKIRRISAVPQAKLEAARASRAAEVSGGPEAVATAQPRSYASAPGYPDGTSRLTAETRRKDRCQSGQYAGPVISGALLESRSLLVSQGDLSVRPAAAHRPLEREADSGWELRLLIGLRQESVAPCLATGSLHLRATPTDRVSESRVCDSAHSVHVVCGYASSVLLLGETPPPACAAYFRPRSPCEVKAEVPPTGP